MAELPVGSMSVPETRRDRARADTLREIKLTARRVLVEQGVDGLALRAVAREMGLSAPALYRYFDSREALVEQVVADLYDDLSGELERVRDAAVPATPGTRLLETARAFRSWATTHRSAFGLLFGSAAQGVFRPEDLHGVGDRPAQLASQRFGAVFATLVAQLYLERPFSVPDEVDVEPALRAQLEGWCAKLPVELPLGVVHVFLSCWIRLYGLVCMEVFGHLRFALDDAAPMFEAELRSLAEVLGAADDYRPPA